MAATAAQQAALSVDPQFIRRFQAILIKKAIALASSGTAPQIVRAKAILQAPVAMAANYAAVICGSTNLVASAISYDFDSGHVVTDVTDGAIESQIEATIFGPLV
jgi:hypothetical protein